MKVSLVNRLYLGFALALILSAVIGYISYYTFRQQTEESKWVKHTYEVINQAEQIQGLIVDMETGRRGFRGTNERVFLAPYNLGLLKIGPELSNLRNLVADNPEEIERADDLSKKVNNILQFWKEKGDDATLYTRDSLVRITTEEKKQMDSIRVVVNDMLAAENKLLATREKGNVDSINLATWVSTIGTIIVQIIIIILIYIIINEFRIRKKAEDALQANLAELERVNGQTSDRNWLLTGLSKVNTGLQGINDVSSVSKLILNVIVSYLEIPAGALYVYDDQKHKLALRSAIALPENAAKEYNIDEGIIGSAGTRKDISIVNDVPASYWKLQSATGSNTPGAILCLPLWLNNELKGVVELVSFKPFTKLQVSLLESMVNNVAVAINSADAREKIILLLEQVQQQKESLQQQEEELRQTNEELIQQAETLQASEEELKVQEEELRQINAELEEKNEAVEIARQSLAAKAMELEITGKYKSEFLANMSHELRTPLNSVLILAKLLSENKQSNLTDKQVEYATVIHRSGNDLLNLINDILDLSKIEAGKIELNFELTPIKNIVKDTYQLFGVLADDKSLKFTTHVDSRLPESIYTDKLRIEQVIKNMLSNAFKFTNKGGSVTLDFNLVSPPANLYNDVLKNSEKLCAISVTDTGIGIPKEKQNMIFEAFQQADGSTSRKYGGTGLGLSISKELVKKLGGEMQLESQEGQGSTFTFFLPLDAKFHAVSSSIAHTDDTPVIIGDVVQQTKLSDDRNNIGPTDKVMLIIEDDIHFAGILQDFARNKKYKTIIALQGDEGLFYARKYRPSAIILDMQLPVISGGQILKMLKGDSNLKNIPVHIISASDEAMQAAPGALAYLKKPVEKEKLDRAFTLIGAQLNTGIKKVLVLSGTYLPDNSLKRIINDRNFNIQCDYTTTEEEAVEKLTTNSYDCVIADIGKNFEKGMEELQQLKDITAQDNIPIIIYMDKNIDKTEEFELKKLSNIVIRDSAQAKDRLMDELELFLYKVEEVENIAVPRRQGMISDDKFLKGKKVLIADDDVRNVFALNTLLEDQQMEVYTADNGMEALSQLNEHPDLDIVLMDVMMPEMDGYEAIKKLREDARFNKLPVIALTAKAMQGDREKSIEAGASDYITKPVDNNRLLSLIRVWLSK
ncbi:MAG: response regulator [Flavipsychrobacter sp.]|nr:response regulator [Flavipsychrobacter sp.]